MIIDEVDYLACLEHHGVKGMHWGVRNQIKKVEKGFSNNEYISALSSKLSPEEKRKNLADSKKKFADKWGGLPSVEPKVGWRPTKREKEVAVAGAAALAVGGVLYFTRSKTLGDLKKASEIVGNPVSEEGYRSALDTPLDTFDEMVGPNIFGGNLSGKSISKVQFMDRVSMSTGRSWTRNYMTPESLKQGDLTFPKGHVFRRFSSSAESSFKQSTYCVNNDDDFNRYGSVFSMGHKANVISFPANDTVRIPSLKTTLETLRSVMQKEEGSKRVVLPKEVVERYGEFSGGNWDGHGLEGKFIKALKARGYHGVVDQMDSGVYGESPLVLFENGKVFGKKTSAPYTTEMIDKSISALKELSYRK